MMETNVRSVSATSARVVGDLFRRLAAADRWEFIAVHASDDVETSGSSTGEPVDVAALRAEARLQRFAGAVLPQVSTALGDDDDRRSLYVIFGRFAHRVVIMRLRRASTGRAFVLRDGAGIERFLRQHDDAVLSAMFDDDLSENRRIAARRAEPISFLVDGSGAIAGSVDESPGDPQALRTLLMPTDETISPVLAPVVDDLLAAYRDGVTGRDLVCVLPFALIRLMPLRGTMSDRFLVTVEWLRSRASLEATAAQYAISKRELQVLSAMLRGAPVAAIAAELSISESTVVFHLKRMLKKTASKNRTELAARMLGWEMTA